MSNKPANAFAGCCDCNRAVANEEKLTLVSGVLARHIGESQFSDRVRDELLASLKDRIDEIEARSEAKSAIRDRSAEALCEAIAMLLRRVPLGFGEYRVYSPNASPIESADSSQSVLCDSRE